jgi:hypothetical protein
VELPTRCGRRGIKKFLFFEKSLDIHSDLWYYNTREREKPSKRKGN